jgi:hypothetical protein
VTRLYSIDHVSLFVTNARSELTTRLICGIPHSLLLSNDNNEVQILVPSVHPVRPFISSAPFSTELVLFRVNPEWISVLDSRFYLYPVHVSLSFMFTPTLASALYLLLLRFFYRDYAEVFRLVNTIGTDTEFSAEEKYIFQCIGQANGDCHPNAHACRLKISLVTIDSPVEPPWNLTKEMAAYVTKLSHVSATCRMSHAEELQLLEQCITDGTHAHTLTFGSAPRLPVLTRPSPCCPRGFVLPSLRLFVSVTDPRYDEKIYTEYEVTLVKNRLYFIRAYVEGRPNTQVFLPPRFQDSGWPFYSDVSALDATPRDWAQISVDFAAPKLASGPTALDTVHLFWNGKENMSGACDTDAGHPFTRPLR